MKNIIEFVETSLAKREELRKVGEPKRWATNIRMSSMGMVKVTLARPKGKRPRHIHVPASEVGRFRLV